MMRFAIHSLAAGAGRYWPVDGATAISGADRRLELPGRPRLVHAPGHTAGHCAVILDERGVAFVGDALVNLDVATGRRGVQLHRFNDDRRAIEVARADG